MQKKTPIPKKHDNMFRSAIFIVDSYEQHSRIFIYLSIIFFVTMFCMGSFLQNAIFVICSCKENARELIFNFNFLRSYSNIYILN